MKQGKTLQELAAEIERQAGAKTDFVADTGALELTSAGTLLMRNGSTQEFEVRDLAHKQIGERLGIPAGYYEKLRSSAPELLAENVNHWMHTAPERRMLRTLDGSLRAFLSDRYHRIDNANVANVILPVLSQVPGIAIKSCEITESRLYIKAVSTELRREVKSRRVGDLVEGGVMITNSEVGLGAVSVKPFAHFLVCTNGMIRDKGLRAAHVGKRVGNGEDSVEALLTDDTKRLEDAAVLAKVRDVVASAFDSARFMEWIAKLEGATQDRIEGDPVKAVEMLKAEFRMTEGEHSSILRHLIEGADLSRYGMANAITRTAEDLASYDRATEFERIGGQLIDLPAGEWNRIAQAA